MEEKETSSKASIDKYLPEPKSRRKGTALCLSGGGYRAALFHLGALRRLHEFGILHRVDTICSVSGGSIIAAHLAGQLIALNKTFKDMSFETDIAEPFREFTSHDIRTGPVLKRFLLPWNWLRRSTQVKALEKNYAKRLTTLSLGRLPEQPRFVFCATDLGCGVNWEFSRARIGDYQLGYQSPPPDWPVARAVAASSCFPPVFDPMSLSYSPSPSSSHAMTDEIMRRKLISSLRLSDGGVYDNLGLEPAWKSHAFVLASDGGAPFRVAPATSIIMQWKRYFGIAGNQCEGLRKRWLISGFEEEALDGTYWGIGSAVERYDPELNSPYSKELASQVISNVRTDMDGFSKAEIEILENHGYLLADAAVRTHCPAMITHESPRIIPHPEWVEETAVRAALKNSHKRIRWFC